MRHVLNLSEVSHTHTHKKHYHHTLGTLTLRSHFTDRALDLVFSLRPFLILKSV